MSNNFPITPGSGDSLTGVDISSFGAYPTTGKVPASVLYVGPSTASAPAPLSYSNPLPICDAGGSITVDGTFWQATQPVSATSLPLPAGAATETTLSALSTKVTTCNTGAVTVSAALPAGSNTIGAVNLAQYTPATGRLPVDGSAVIQPVSGTVTANAGSGTFAVSAASLPLPAGAATEATLSTLNGKVTACNTGAVTVSAALPAGTNTIGAVGGNKVEVAVELTRPADTTAYAANDVVSDSTSATTPLAFANFARVNGGSGYITKARLVTDKKSITPSIRVHLFNANTATLAADNAAFKDLYADDSKRIGYFDLPAMTTAADTTNSTCSRALNLDLRIPFVAAGGARSIYAVLETIDVFTPASGQKFTLTLAAELD